MADETKTQIPKPTRQRGPMGRMGGMRRGEKAKDFKGTMRQLLGYIGQHKIAVFTAVAFAVCSVIFNIVGPKVLGQVTTKLFEGLVAKVNGTGDVDFNWIAKTLGFLLCLYLASSACSLIQGWLMTGVTQKICYRMRKEIAAKIAVVPMSYFNGHSKGDVLSRITNDVDTLGQSLNQSVTQLITSVTQIIGVLVMMLSISLPLTGVTVLTLPAAAIILMVMIHFSQPYFREQQQVLGTVNGIIEEDFAGQNVIQVFDRAEASIEEFDRQNDRLFISGWRSQFLSGLMMPLMSLVGNMGYVGVVVVGAQLALTGNATPGDIQSFIQYVRNFTQPVQQLGNVSNTMQSMAAATERVFEFLAAPEEEQKADAQIPEKRPGHVEFDHVKFGYTPDKTIIHDFSCEAQPGQTIAIVGPTGAGKTTLIKLLQRFYDVDGGSLRVEGVDVRDWDRAALRGEFAMVLQDTWLFNGTIRENIRYGRPDASDAEVEAAARAARCDHFIHTLAGGYDFMINEEGTNLSQGQRQLVTIARAILADRPALILDEATSNVDTRTEELIQRAMDALMQGRTSFVIAHRLSTIRNADVILVIRDGDIVEKGTHDELLAQGGFYADLYNSQFDEAA
ncbi:ABC transporter ATP-binding protein [Collinsella aerofaciens]|uniref:ABC transporter ATP-binding protein n=1 Tax=Collinsella aerofaciens TaxID=74426 RepID=UPI00232DF4E2|nr:ABC transporter ATP-binding protein [Collinsella aerofaciens]MDB1908194.1 ABC transporter ATP-binding protein [Collinsella aerofaciens]MDB1910194.1 ABC transporter ATP-binding protein [Collinsella aerofaciens]MDB1912455.1 ABC transporter ATP-binding protein [Collinsella aerofaciens]